MKAPIEAYKKYLARATDSVRTITGLVGVTTNKLGEKDVTWGDVQSMHAIADSLEEAVRSIKA